MGGRGYLEYVCGVKLGEKAISLNHNVYIEHCVSSVLCSLFIDTLAAINFIKL